jgi:hypothetical protein
MIHGKLRDPQGPCRDYVGIIIFCVTNYVTHKKLRDSRKNYVIHVKLADDFLIERNCANLWLHCHHVGIDIDNIHEKHCLN